QAVHIQRRTDPQQDRPAPPTRSKCLRQSIARSMVWTCERVLVIAIEAEGHARFPAALGGAAVFLLHLPVVPRCPSTRSSAAFVACVHAPSHEPPASLCVGDAAAAPL